MKKLLAALIAGVVLALPLASLSGPDESQKVMIQRAMDAKKKLAAAQAASGVERQKAMQEHMNLMREIMAQMQKAKPAGGLKPEQMREWIDEHLKLMHEMMGQMMDEHHMMMQDMNMKGMHGAGKK